LEIAQTDVKNNISIFDDSIFHQIYIDIDKEQYEYILQSYKNNKEKEFVSVNITIDGKTIKNV
jgi:spore coat protein CotH